MGQIDLDNHTIQKNINTKKKQVLGNWKMNVIALTMAICALFVMNLEISFAGLKEREVSMMRTGEAPAYRSIEREELAYRSIEREEPAYRNIEREDYTRTREDNPTSGGVEDRRRRRRYRGKREIMDGEHQLEDRRYRKLNKHKKYRG